MQHGLQQQQSGSDSSRVYIAILAHQCPTASSPQFTSHHLTCPALRLPCPARRYGLCGPNGVGKSTLMRAIANGQVDGFPPADELRTVYVEHDIQASLADLNVVDFVFADPLLHTGGE